MTIKTTDAHHPCGPSVLGRLMACPASFGLSENEPNTSSDEAKEGTLLHEAVRKLLSRDPDWADGLNDEQVDLCERCYDFADEKAPDCVPLLEQKVSLTDDVGLINHGTADFVGVCKDKVVVIDWKFGRKIKENSIVLQVCNYAAAAVKSMYQLADVTKLHIEALAYFPRTGDELFWSARTGDECVHLVTPEIRSIVNAAKAAEPEDLSKENVGPHCDYCPHLPNCAAVREVAETEIAKATPDDLVDPKKALRLYDLSLVVEKQAKAVRAGMRDLLLKYPDAIPGLVLKDRKSKRSIPDPAKLKTCVVDPECFSIVEYMRACAPSVVALEEAYLSKFYQGRKKGMPTKQDLKNELAARCGKLIKVSKSKVLTRV